MNYSDSQTDWIIFVIKSILMTISIYDVDINQLLFVYSIHLTYTQLYKYGCSALKINIKNLCPQAFSASDTHSGWALKSWQDFAINITKITRNLYSYVKHKSPWKLKMIILLINQKEECLLWKTEWKQLLYLIHWSFIS